MHSFRTLWNAQFSMTARIPSLHFQKVFRAFDTCECVTVNMEIQTFCFLLLSHIGISRCAQS